MFISNLQLQLIYREIRCYYWILYITIIIFWWKHLEPIFPLILLTNKPKKRKKKKLDDSRTSMPALARPCTSGVETSKHMQVTCWHCGCWDHYECVDNRYLSPCRIGGKWLPWFLRKSRPFIFKYRPLGPTYFNIWGIFTIVGIFLIKWYNIPLMQFASLTLEGAHP